MKWNQIYIIKFNESYKQINQNLFHAATEYELWTDGQNNISNVLFNY